MVFTGCENGEKLDVDDDKGIIEGEKRGFFRCLSDDRVGMVLCLRPKVFPCRVRSVGCVGCVGCV